MKRKTIVIATRNKGKLREFRSILADGYDEILSLADFEEVPEIKETGLSFRENAFIKAKTTSDFLEMDAIGDDSGLVVDALGELRGFIRQGTPGRGPRIMKTTRNCSLNLKERKTEMQDLSAVLL